MEPSRDLGELSDALEPDLKCHDSEDHEAKRGHHVTRGKRAVGPVSCSIRMYASKGTGR